MKDIEVTIDHFRNCNWSSAIVAAKNYFSAHRSLSMAANKATEDNNSGEGKVLSLLANVCSMTLNPSSFNEPFQAGIIMDGKRTALPDDFNEEEIKLLSQIAEEIDDYRLRARIADILWLLVNPKEPSYALLAIDNYIKFPITTDGWVSDARESWDRAIQLSKMLGSGSGNRLQEIENELLSNILNASSNEGNLTLWIYNLLSKHDLSRNSLQSIAEKLKQLAFELANSDKFPTMFVDYMDSAAELFRKLGQDNEYLELTIKVAEYWVKAAEVNQDTSNNIVAVTFYDNAIQKYRNIPKNLRNAYDVDNRIENLILKRSSAGKQSIGEMHVISSPAIDISGIIENSMDKVKGKIAIDALLALANIFRGTKVNQMRESTEKIIQEHPLSSFFPATHFASDGRVVAKRFGVDPSGDQDNDAIWTEMINRYQMEIEIAICGCIWPALKVIRLEHRIREYDFLIIVKQSPIVPDGRERLLAKALFAGYDGDFITALHIIIPQIENIVRYHLKQRGVKTTNLNQNGIENENGLSSLMDIPEVKHIFGADMSFEIKALFCDPHGPNLRNELAHGLLEYNQLQSTFAIYAWWLGFRIIFNTFWNAKQAFEKDKEQIN